MLHWLSVYLLHPLRGAGYAWWSGAGSDLMYVGAIVGVYRHVACEQRGCLRPGHRHPNHGRPVCRRHFHSDVQPERKP